jgi:poly(3-hydroxyalkanoate) synthetase
LNTHNGTNATTLSGGTIIGTGLGSDTSQNRGGVSRVDESDLAIGSNIAGTPQEIYLGIQRLTGTTETFYSSIVWSETN